MNIEVVVSAGALLGESPVWSVAEQVLYWVDIDGRRVHRFDPATGRDEERDISSRPGSVALTGRPGRLLVAAEHELVWLQWETGRVDHFLGLEPAGTGNRLNDGRADPGGRFWVGSMHERPSERRFTGLLHRVSVGGGHQVVDRGLGVSNSLAFALDGHTMYRSDTLRGVVWALDFEPATGRATRPRLFTDFAGLPGGPDGAAVDQEGCLWIACVHGGAVARFTPAGALDRLVELPVPGPTMPAFGGSRLDTLFVTSLGAAISASAPAASPLAGAVLAFQPGVAGLAEPDFGGSPASEAGP